MKWDGQEQSRTSRTQCRARAKRCPKYGNLASPSGNKQGSSYFVDAPAVLAESVCAYWHRPKGDDPAVGLHSVCEGGGNVDLDNGRLGAAKRVGAQAFVQLSLPVGVEHANNDGVDSSHELPQHVMSQGQPDGKVDNGIS